MSYDDFVKHYTDFEICSVSVGQMYEDESGNVMFQLSCVYYNVLFVWVVFLSFFLATFTIARAVAKAGLVPRLSPHSNIDF